MALGQSTKNELAIRILRDLNIISATANEIPSAEDMNYVLDTIDSEFAGMQADGIRFWGTTVNSIHPMYFTELSRRIGLAVAPPYGIISIAQAEQGIRLSEDKLRRMGSPVRDVGLMSIERAARGVYFREPIINSAVTNTDFNADDSDQET